MFSFWSDPRLHNWEYFGLMSDFVFDFALTLKNLEDREGDFGFDDT
jgi:hypothetical protein